MSLLRLLLLFEGIISLPALLLVLLDVGLIRPRCSSQRIVRFWPYPSQVVINGCSQACHSMGIGLLKSDIMFCNLSGWVVRVPELFLQLILGGDRRGSRGCRPHRSHRRRILLRLVFK